MSTQQQKAEAFLAAHHGDAPLLLANAWDVGSAKVLAGWDSARRRRRAVDTRARSAGATAP